MPSDAFNDDDKVVVRVEAPCTRREVLRVNQGEKDGGGGRLAGVARQAPTPAGEELPRGGASSVIAVSPV